MNGVLLLKATSWRLISIPITLLITYLYTGKAGGSLTLTAILTVVLTACQFGYEKLWIRYLEGPAKKALKAYKPTP